MKLGEMLIADKVISASQLEYALLTQKKAKKQHIRLGTLLLSLKIIEARTLVKYLAMKGIYKF